MSKKRAPRTNIYFKIDEENRLIDLVRRYEESYDPRQRMRDIHVRKKIWTEIGAKNGKRIQTNATRHLLNRTLRKKLMY